jgi:YD repeat-containing protein
VAAKQCYAFDPFGNLTGRGTAPINQACFPSPISVDPSTNRVSGAGYDAAGAMTSWGSGGLTYCYEWYPTGQVRRVQGGGRTSHFAYDADGERIAWYDSQEGATHYTLRGLDGQVLREYRELAGEWSWVKDYVYRDGQHLASIDSAGTRHAHLDHLGTIRRITGTGTPPAVLAAHDYYPFGEEATDPYQDAERMKYTGHERDLQDPSNTTDDLDNMRPLLQRIPRDSLNRPYLRQSFRPQTLARTPTCPTTPSTSSILSRLQAARFKSRSP